MKDCTEAGTTVSVGSSGNAGVEFWFCTGAPAGVGLGDAVTTTGSDCARNDCTLPIVCPEGVLVVGGCDRVGCCCAAAWLAARTLATTLPEIVVAIPLLTTV